MINPNPLNPKKYVSVIGYNTEISLGNSDIGNSQYESGKDISAYGFYDYKVWINSGQYYSTEIEGFFDNIWQ